MLTGCPSVTYSSNLLPEEHSIIEIGNLCCCTTPGLKGRPDSDPGLMTRSRKAASNNKVQKWKTSFGIPGIRRSRADDVQLSVQISQWLCGAFPFTFSLVLSTRYSYSSGDEREQSNYHTLPLSFPWDYCLGFTQAYDVTVDLCSTVNNHCLFAQSTVHSWWLPTN